MTELVRLRKRPSRDGETFVYMLDYKGENGKRKRVSLGHADRRKAEKERIDKERELRMGIIAPESMRLSDFLEDSLTRTGDQVRESTHDECRCAMKHLIEVIGNIDYQRVNLSHGELSSSIKATVRRQWQRNFDFLRGCSNWQCTESSLMKIHSGISKCQNCQRKKWKGTRLMNVIVLLNLPEKA